MTTTVTGLFRSLKTAERAVQRLEDAGHERSAISVVLADTPHYHRIVRAQTEDTPRGVLTGAAVGGALAAILTGALAVPLPGVLVAGPLLSMLTAGGTGAAAGSVAGALVGHNTSEQVAMEYDTHIAAGEILVGVDTDRQHAAAAVELLRASGARMVSDSVHFTPRQSGEES